MAEENKFVLRHEWEKSKGKVHERINEIDNKHMNLHNDINLKVITMGNVLERISDNGDKTNETLNMTNQILTEQKDQMKDVKYKVETTINRVDNIESSVSERQKGNVQIMVAVITTIGTIVVGALGLAQFFF